MNAFSGKHIQQSTSLECRGMYIGSRNTNSLEEIMIYPGLWALGVDPYYPRERKKEINRGRDNDHKRPEREAELCFFAPCPLASDCPKARVAYPGLWAFGVDPSCPKTRVNHRNHDSRIFGHTNHDLPGPLGVRGRPLLPKQQGSLPRPLGTQKKAGAHSCTLFLLLRGSDKLNIFSL